MKKKLFVTLIAVCTLLLMLCSVSALAERSTNLPVVFTSSSGYSQLTLNDFWIDTVEAYPDYQNLRIYFTADYNTSYSSVDLAFHCYDINGNFIKTIPINTYSDYIDAPYGTAMLEMVSNGAVYSDTYFYCYYETVYAPDGRTAYITDLQVPVYEKAGWAQGVCVYSFSSDDVILISPYQIAEYQNAGWYTWDEYAYRELQTYGWDYIKNGDYESAVYLAEDYEEYLAGTAYEYSVQVLKAQFIDAWRNKEKQPFIYTGYATEETSDNNWDISIWFRNLSYKKVIAFRLDFDTYNVFGERNKDYYTYYYCDDANHPSFDEQYYTWDIYTSDNIYSVKNVRITEVVFEDGTKWVR